MGPFCFCCVIFAQSSRLHHGVMFGKLAALGGMSSSLVLERLFSCFSLDTRHTSHLRFVLLQVEGSLERGSWVF